MATGMAATNGGKIGVICTERGSARKYSDRFKFMVLDLHDKTIGGYIKAINAAAKAGIDYLIIDSTTHAWDELLEEIDKLAKAKYRGNTWSAWSDGTPKQKKFIGAQLDFPGHLFATMRSKTAWEQEKDPITGKSKPIRVGLAPSQGKMIEYEYDMLIELNTEHYATVIKDRTGKFQDIIIEKPGEEFGVEVVEWLTKDGPAQLEAKPEEGPVEQPETMGASPDSVKREFQYGPAVGRLDKLAEKTAEFIQQKIEAQDLKLFGLVHFMDDDGAGKTSRKQWSRVEFGMCEEWLRECCRQMKVVDPTAYVISEEG
jgi:hypothetical protein